MSVYVSAPLCAEAKRELARAGGRVGEVHLRAACVDDGAKSLAARSNAGRAGRSRLALIGAAARAATEDSSSVAYIGTRDPTAVRFSEPILEEAGIVRISADSGATGVARLLRAFRRIEDPESPRESLAEELG